MLWFLLKGLRHIFFSILILQSFLGQCFRLLSIYLFLFFAGHAKFRTSYVRIAPIFREVLRLKQLISLRYQYSTGYTHKTSGFKTSGFKTSGFKTSGFKTSGLQNVRFTKRQVSKRLVSKHPVFKLDILIKQKVFVFVIFTYYLPLWWYMTKKPQKLKIKHSHHFACKHCCNRTCGFPPTTSTEYIWMFFCNQTFWRPDVL